jgi:hypothetical protein
MILRFLTTVFGLIAVVLTAVIGIALLTSVDENKFGGATNVSVESAPVELGEAALVGDVEFTLNGAEVRESVGGLFFSQSAQTNEVFLAIRYTYRNVGSSPISSWSEPRIRLVDGYGTEYSSDVGASSRYATEIDVNINVLSDINPGVSQTGGDVFVLGRDYFHSNDWKLKVSQGGRQALFSLTRNDNVFIEEKSSTDPIDEVLGVVSQVFGETVSSSSELLIEVPGADDLSADASRRDDFSSDEVVAKVQVVGIDYGDDLKVWSEPLSLLPPVGSVPNRNAMVGLIRCVGEATAEEWLIGAHSGSKPNGVWCEINYSMADADVRGWVNAINLDVVSARHQ